MYKRRSKHPLKKTSNMASMLEQLMELPLFRGVSHTRMAQTVGDAKFHFLKYPEGEVIIRSGDRCEHITFILSGSVRSVVSNESKRFSIAQTISAPAALAPNFLFGRITNYPYTVTAHTGGASILQISKSDYVKILQSDTVFLFNFLNALSVCAQKGIDGILSLTSGSIEQRIAFWIVALTQPGGSDVVLSCLRRDLCSIFGVQRTTFEAALENMKKSGLITYSLKELRVTDRRRLVLMLERDAENGGEVHD